MSGTHKTKVAEALRPEIGKRNEKVYSARLW